MKSLYYAAMLGMAAIVINIAWENFAAQRECSDAAVAVLQTGAGLNGAAASKAIDAGCARVVRNGHVAERVLNALP